MKTLYEVEIHELSDDSKHVSYLSLEEIIEAPGGMNMADVGLHLLNLEREKLGLEKISPDRIAPFLGPAVITLGK